jgi:hypothetical protein
MKKMILTLIILFSILVMGALTNSIAAGIYSNQTESTLQPVKEGDKYTFEGGVLYHRAGFVPQLIVSGTHYQMGRQYGALLRSEIKYTVDSVDRLLAMEAGEQRLPLWLVKIYAQFQAQSIANRLPSRFIDEIKGVAEGSGLPYKKILITDMIYDIYRLTGCTGIIWRSPSGEIYHGHTTDIGWGLDWPPTIIVKHNPTGYNSFTSITWAGFLGTQTAYNSNGLCYSENTLTSEKINWRGFSVNYLARIIMEECSSLSETASIFNKYGTINGEAMVLSDLTNGTGAIVETTPLSPPSWALIPMRGNTLWDLNFYQTPDFSERVQDNLQTSNGFNTGRLRILNDYFSTEKVYDLDSLIELLRTSQGPDGKDYAKNAYLSGICNNSGLQMLIFHPQGKGIYLATGNYYASRNAVVFYPDDFREAPSLYKAALPLEPVVEQAARLLNSFAGRQELYQSWCRLAEQYPNEAFVEEYAGWAAFACGNKTDWVKRIELASELEPDFAEYKIMAACGAFYQQNYSQVITLLEPVDPGKLISVKYQALRLELMAKSYRDIDKYNSKNCSEQLILLCKHNHQLKGWLASYIKLLN